MDILIRLADVIVWAKERVGSFERLAEEIRMANRRAGASEEDLKRLRVDRRKLSAIAEKRPVSLTVYELQALDTYLSHVGKQGLKAVFEKRTLIGALAATELVDFLIGAKPQPDKTFALSRWDVRSMITVIHGIHSISPSVVIDIHDVLLEPRATRAHLESQTEEVQKLLDDRRGRSIVCIGSPRACHASELMLAEMFNVTRFTRRGRSSDDQLPFYFVWSDDQYKSLPSRFALRASDVLGETSINNDEKEWKSVALKTTDPEHIYRVDRKKRVRKKLDPKKKVWKNYGVVVVQRRETGKLWIVAAGLSGPSTLAVANSLASVGDELIMENPEEKSPVVWAVVEAGVQQKRGAWHPGEDRILTGERIISPIRVWPPGAASG